MFKNVKNNGFFKRKCTEKYNLIFKYKYKHKILIKA